MNDTTATTRIDAAKVIAGDVLYNAGDLLEVKDVRRIGETVRIFDINDRGHMFPAAATVYRVLA